MDTFSVRSQPVRNTHGGGTERQFFGDADSARRSAKPAVSRQHHSWQPAFSRSPANFSPSPRSLVADGFTNYTFSFPENGQQYIGRLDYLLTQKQTILFRAFENDQTNPFHSPPDNIHASRTGGYQDSISATVGYNYTINSGTVVHTQLSGMHLKSQAESDFNKSINRFWSKRVLSVERYRRSTDEQRRYIQRAAAGNL